MYFETQIVLFYQENHKESEYDKIDSQKWTQKAPIGNKTLWINTQTNKHTHNPPQV